MDRNTFESQHGKKIDAYLDEVATIANDILPTILEAFRERAEEHNLDPLAALYVIGKAYILIASFCDEQMRIKGLSRDERDALAEASQRGIELETKQHRDENDEEARDWAKEDGEEDNGK